MSLIIEFPFNNSFYNKRGPKMPSANGGLRQPVFKGIREDKSPKDCTI
ncbi:hypothetical protein KPL47_19935 [Clostridium estertheticum]|nr:hypothetical protein [Clostridium estertheticum]MBU3178590.1 hypothetical protein [Clostridium estertheticum]